jgi:general secretion pathway protein H
MRSGDALISGNAAGFTLLEMLIVLAILAVAATAIPLIGHGGADLRGFGYGLAAELRDLRDTARRSGAVTEFQLLPQTGGYRLGDQDLTLPAGVSVTYTVDEPPLVGDALDHLAFYPDGSATGGRLALTRGGVQIVITVEPLDGRIAIDG